MNINIQLNKVNERKSKGMEMRRERRWLSGVICLKAIGTAVLLLWHNSDILSTPARQS